MKYGLFVLILFFSNISIGNNLSNKILAVVNNNIITSQEIKSKLDIAASLDEKKSILNNSIDNLLIKELIDDFNLKPSSNEINEALGHIARKNKISVSELRQNQNFEHIKKDVVKQLSIFNLKIYLTKDYVLNISRKEVNLYCNNIGSSLTKQIKIAEIIIIEPSESTANKAEKDLRIKKFLKVLSSHISKGASFTSLAKLHSQNLSYLNGGISEWRNLNSSFLQEINELPLNQVSNIYQKESGWAIAIKIDDREINLKLEECKKEISNLKAETIFKEYIHEFRNNSNITKYEQNL